MSGALWVPFVVVLLGIAPYLAMPLLDSDDRAIVWITGSDTAVQAAIARASNDAAFDGAARRVTDALPPGCPAGAVRLHFEIQRVDEAQLARALLEGIAATAGATVCASNHFELNRGDDSGAWVPLAMSLMLPVGFLLAVHVVAPFPRVPVVRITPRLAWQGCLLAVVATLLAPLPGAAAAGGAMAIPLLATALLPPAIHELAFRGWLLARLAPAIGDLRAAIVSLLASVLAAMPLAEPSGLGSAAAVAAVCAALYLRTRSIPACIATHLLLTAAGRALESMS